MSADADDLIERAARALDRDVPTTDEVTAELADALDELERDFPDGGPGKDAPGFTRLRYSSLVGEVRHCRWQLENGQCIEFPRGRRSRFERADGETSWEAFLVEHPELSEKSGSASQEQPTRAPLTFTDAELMRALRSACKAWDRRMPAERRGQGVLSSYVADELAGVALVRGEGRVPKELVPSQRDVTKVGVALARLAREGKVERTNRTWESNCWAPKKRGGRDAR